MFKKSELYAFKSRDYRTIYPDYFFDETFEPYVERVLKIKIVMDEVEEEVVFSKEDLGWLMQETPNETK